MQPALSEHSIASSFRALDSMASAQAKTATAAPKPANTAVGSSVYKQNSLGQEGLRAAVRSAWAGLGAGFLHTLSGPDHLAALTPLTIGRSNIKATLMGALWGFGHSIGQLILGLLMVLLKDRFTSLVPALTKYGATTVGLTLLVIGVAGLYETLTEGAEVADEAQPALAGAGVCGSAAAVPSSSSTAPAEIKVTSNLSTLFTGIVFGLQPDALFVIVPALALPTKAAATAYILMFVFGTVAAMGSYTAFIGATSSTLQKNYSGLCSRLSGIASSVAIAVGLTVLAAGWGIRLPFGFGQ
ncbi:g10744 [Coccomyxa viridis]|uniref:G10744 protein n=1 Tax=Coccomyxa viridis TaxID=1274662 RepID=A0ABP1G634_9CHLO